MCGRYALWSRPSVVRQRLEDQHLPADQAPDDNDERIRQSYNFAPGYHGLIYRADVPDHGAGSRNENGEPSPKKAKTMSPELGDQLSKDTTFKLQAARWGLIPFWTKRAPDYGSQMKTINCRDDSLIDDSGMWTVMKKRKRCIVLAEGFYEWLKKNNGKEKIPHYMKRKDGLLMCFAGLWDVVKFEDSDEKLYTYTIITTDSNKQLRFLHDRMPVILEAGSDAMKAWLDPDNSGWSPALQKLLKPYQGEIDCYPVDKAVGKVGNNSANFVIPVNSKENKKNIANFFDKQKMKQEEEERDRPDEAEDPESNAPLPQPNELSENEADKSKKLEPIVSNHEVAVDKAGSIGSAGNIKQEADIDDDDEQEHGPPPTAKHPSVESWSPGNNPRYDPDRGRESKSPVKSDGKRKRSATSNMSSNEHKTPTKKPGNSKITNFFGSQL